MSSLGFPLLRPHELPSLEPLLCGIIGGEPYKSPLRQGCLGRSKPACAHCPRSKVRTAKTETVPVMRLDHHRQLVHTISCS